MLDQKPFVLRFSLNESTYNYVATGDVSAAALVRVVAARVGA